jgi:heptosyltransferase-2
LSVLAVEMMGSKARLLVIRIGDLGDVLLATPALAALREAHPKARIDVLTSSIGAAILAGTDLVNSLVPVERHLLDRQVSALSPQVWLQVVRLLGKLRGRYDVAILMHHLTTQWGAMKWRALLWGVRPQLSVGLDNGRGSFLTLRVADAGFGASHEAEYALRLVGTLGASTASRPLQYRVGEAPRAKAADILAGARRPLVAIHPGSGLFSTARRWPAVSFAALADALVEEFGATVVLLGGDGDDSEQVASLMHHRPLNLAHRTPSLELLAAVLAQCALFVGNDSGVMHLATAVGIPVVALFGPTDPAAWGPWRPGGSPAAPAIALQGPCPSGKQPCLYRGHSLGSRSGCRERGCLEQLRPERVLAAIRSLGVL